MRLGGVAYQSTGRRDGGFEIESIAECTELGTYSSQALAKSERITHASELLLPMIIRWVVVSDVVN